MGHNDLLDLYGRFLSEDGLIYLYINNSLIILSFITLTMKLKNCNTAGSTFIDTQIDTR